MAFITRNDIQTKDLAGLQAEINTKELSAQNPVLYIESADDTVWIHFSIAPSPEQETEIDTAITSFTQLTPVKQVQQVVRMAVDFGNQVIFDFTVENVLLGITQMGLTSHVRRVTTPIITALTTGSLYDAIAEVRLLNTDDFDSVILTPARLLTFRNKIEAYLGVPLAQTWNE